MVCVTSVAILDRRDIRRASAAMRRRCAEQCGTDQACCCPIRAAEIRTVIAHAALVFPHRHYVSERLGHAVRLVTAFACWCDGDLVVHIGRRGLAVARLIAIKADIDMNLIHGDVSLSAVAARHGLSFRSVQRLFERETLTFTGFVLGRRLAYAYWLLVGTKTDDRTICDAAFGAGFNDLSYFNRTFRRRYGVTPSEVRGLFAGDRRCHDCRRGPVGQGAGERRRNVSLQSEPQGAAGCYGLASGDAPSQSRMRCRLPAGGRLRAGQGG